MESVGVTTNDVKHSEAEKEVIEILGGGGELDQRLGPGPSPCSEHEPANIGPTVRWAPPKLDSVGPNVGQRFDHTKLRPARPPLSAALGSSGAGSVPRRGCPKLGLGCTKLGSARPSLALDLHWTRGKKLDDREERDRMIVLLQAVAGLWGPLSVSSDSKWTGVIHGRSGTSVV